MGAGAILQGRPLQASGARLLIFAAFLDGQKLNVARFSTRKRHARVSEGANFRDLSHTGEPTTTNGGRRRALNASLTRNLWDRRDSM